MGRILSANTLDIILYTVLQTDIGLNFVTLIGSSDLGTSMRLDRDILLGKCPVRKKLSTSLRMEGPNTPYCSCIILALKPSGLGALFGPNFNIAANISV